MYLFETIIFSRIRIFLKRKEYINNSQFDLYEICCEVIQNKSHKKKSAHLLSSKIPQHKNRNEDD